MAIILSWIRNSQPSGNDCKPFFRTFALSSCNFYLLSSRNEEEKIKMKVKHIHQSDLHVPISDDILYIVYWSPEAQSSTNSKLYFHEGNTKQNLQLEMLNWKRQYCKGFIIHMEEKHWLGWTAPCSISTARMITDSDSRQITWLQKSLNSQMDGSNQLACSV